MESMMKSTEPQYRNIPIPEQYLRPRTIREEVIELLRINAAILAVGAAVYQVLMLALGIH